MFIYNTTFFVADKVYGRWMKWLKEVHIPDMTKNHAFSHPQIAKVIGRPDESYETSISVQFHISGADELKKWVENEEEKLVSEISEKFGTEALLFSTILEIIE